MFGDCRTRGTSTVNHIIAKTQETAQGQIEFWGLGMSEEFELPVSIEDLKRCGLVGSDHPTMLVNGMRYLCRIGFAPEDVADAIYTNPHVGSSLQAGNYVTAADHVAIGMAFALKEIRNVDITEDRLWILTEAGLAVCDISWAFKNTNRFPLEAPQLDTAYARSVYERIQKGRGTRLTSRTTRWGRTTESVTDRKGKAESWFEHYTDIIQKVIELRMPDVPFPKPSVYTGSVPDVSALDKYIARAKRKAELAEMVASGELDEEDLLDIEDEDSWDTLTEEDRGWLRH